MITKTPELKQLMPYELIDEMDLILSCSKGYKNTENQRNIIHLLKKGLNWDHIYRQAGRYGLIPLLYYNLKFTAPELVPEDILQKMSEIYLSSLTQSMIQIRELLQVIQLCTDHEIPIIPYKGAALSQQIYGDIGLRLSSDIDIIVRQQDVIRAKDLLISQGYIPQVSLTHELDTKFIRVDNEHHLSHPHKTMIDIHWQFMSRYYLVPFEETEIWAGLKMISLDGTEILSLSTEMQIISLCIHGAKHQWKELKHISDIAAFISSDKDINWELILTIAQEKRIKRIIFLGLRLVEMIMKIELPIVVSEAIRCDSGMQFLVPFCIDNIFTEERKPEDDIQFVFYWVSIRECLWDKLRVIPLLVFKPNYDDWRYISLPKNFFLLYYIIRPIRLAFEYGVPR